MEWRLVICQNCVDQFLQLKDDTHWDLLVAAILNFHVLSVLLIANGHLSMLRTHSLADYLRDTSPSSAVLSI